ncbi:MAG: flagellin FliC [Chitinispirillaceae bacterium]|nr:flagellin FliC [Chitinispirillaceae bacterium]
MRINHNISSMVTQNSLFSVNRDMSKSLERLSTGLRINRASDDAAGLGVSENLRTQVRGTSQAIRNAQDGIAAITIAEGAANEISAIMQRMRELAVQSANDTLTSTERAYTDQEFGQLIDEIDRIAAVTNYNGMKLISSEGTTANERFGLGGTGGTGSALWIDANDSYGLDSITITIDTLTAGDMGIGSTAVSLSDQAASVSAIQALDGAIDSVNTMRSDMGAFINRLEHAINNLMISNTNQQAAESLIRDVDFAAETTQYTRNQILVQSGTAMLSQANMLPQGVLQLLQ